MLRDRNAAAPLEIWGGVECTVNRVGDEYHDQLERNGHASRIEDLDLIAGLGIRTIRYPVLWERIAPDGIANADWSWSDARLQRLRELEMTPIVGLVHHGSGPRHTSLIDPAFPEKLAEYAGAVAARYPWVDMYTPVNEPLTTARFCGLYGLWYPHGRDGATFARALLGQCRGIALAMRAIREVNPSARLVQTEDFGKTFSTPLLAYQAHFDNARRWLTFDLLCGRLDEQHFLWQHFHDLGCRTSELEWFLENPTPPDIIGINHYLTSERFLDHRLERYPERTHGGNGKHSYADVEAVRVLADGPDGPKALLREVWDRYRLPMAVTEVHLGCTREEQVRWLMEVHCAARELHDEGVDIRAVTAWSLLGAYDWSCLLTRRDGEYESGAFDLRGAAPRPTAVARLIRSLVSGHQSNHPLLATPGWWKRPERLVYPPVDLVRSGVRNRLSKVPSIAGRSVRNAGRPMLITGATGTLGQAFARLCHVRGIPHVLTSRTEMDITDRTSVRSMLNALDPWCVINAAGYVRVDDAENDPERCFRENSDGPAILALECAMQSRQLVVVSSDLVFDGCVYRPYLESDPTTPINVYGRSKAEAESLVLDAYQAALVIRTSAFFGPFDRYNFVTQALEAVLRGESFVAADDAVISPTYVPDLVHATLDLLIDGESGIWHLANQGEITWLDLARTAVGMAGLDTGLINGVPTGSMGLAAPRPLYSALSSERGQLLPTLDNALGRYLQERWPRLAERQVEMEAGVLV